MRFQKIISAISAAAMAVTMLSAMPVNAAVGDTYTGTVDEWGLINFSIDLTTLSDNEAIRVESYDAGEQQWPMVRVMASDANTNWGEDCAINFNIINGTSADDPDVKIVNVSDLKAKYKEVAGTDWTSSTVLRLSFWNDGAAKPEVSIVKKISYDSWTENDDGSYYYAAQSKNDNWDEPLVFDLDPDKDGHIFVADFSANGDAWIKVGYNDGNGDWKTYNNDENFNVKDGKLVVINDTEGFDQIMIWAGWVNTNVTANVSAKTTPRSDTISTLNAGDEYDIFGVEEATGKVVQRHIKVVQLSDLDDVASADFQFSDGTKTKTATTTKYYTSLGEGYPAVASGCVILTAYVKGIPEKLDCVVTLNDIPAKG